MLRTVVVESEAYLAAGDPASHSYRGPGKSNASMFANSGTLYVYPIHSRHCMNVVSESIGSGAAILIRSAEPLSGWNAMWKNRFAEKPPLEASKNCPNESVERNLQWHRERRLALQLSQGPGRLCECLNVDRKLDGVDLRISDRIWFETPDEKVINTRWRIKSSPRIGISKAQRLRLRWFIDGHQFVSGRASDHSAGKFWSFMHVR